MREEYYYIASFRSRAQTIRYYELLRGIGLAVYIVNTPPQASVGCGISVKITPEQLSCAKKAFCPQDYTAFIGWFSVHNERGYLHVAPIE